MLLVYYYPDADLSRGQLIHDVNSDKNKLISGYIKDVLNTVSTFEFSIGLNHPLYGSIQPFKGLIQVINPLTGKELFFGRVLKPSGMMTNNGLFTQSFLCEDALGFLNDSTPRFKRFDYINEFNFVYELFYEHNLQVEEYKQFEVGEVEVEPSTMPDSSYLGIDTAFDLLKNRLGLLGGYITLKRSGSKWKIDWKKEIGTHKDVPIEIGNNLKSSSRSTEFENMFTRIVPFGYQSGTKWLDDESIVNRLDIASVNEGKLYLEDSKLVRQFGIITRPVIFDEIRDVNELLDTAYRYLQDQHQYLASWEVDVVDKSYIDPNYESFNLGDYYPVINPPIATTEYMQVTEKTTDVLQPHKVSIRLGTQSHLISKYYREVEKTQKQLRNLVKHEGG